MKWMITGWIRTFRSHKTTSSQGLPLRLRSFVLSLQPMLVTDPVGEVPKRLPLRSRFFLGDLQFGASHAELVPLQIPAPVPSSPPAVSLRSLFGLDPHLGCQAAADFRLHVRMLPFAHRCVGALGPIRPAL